MNNEFVSLKELAQHFNISQRWLRAETAAGRIPFIRAGKKSIFSIVAVKQALEARMNGASSVDKAVPHAV